MLKLKDILKEDLSIKTTNKPAGYIYNWKEEMKEGKFDPKNPTIHIVGLAVYSWDSLCKSIAGQLEDVAKRLRKGFDMDVQYSRQRLIGNDVVLYKLKALDDVRKELNTSVWKRRITMYKKKR